MKVRKKIAWMLSFLMIFSFVMGNTDMKARAQGAGTGFTVNITDNTGMGNGNRVSYRFGQSEGWITVSSGNAIDISEQNGIDVKVERADSSEVTVDITGTGFATTDFLGTFGDNGQRFELADGQSYTLNVIFNRNNQGGDPQNPATPNPPQEIQNPETISVNVSEGANLLDTYGNYLSVDGINVQNGSVTVEQATTHRIGVLCQFGFSISRANINGSDISLVSRIGDWYYYDVADASAYDIKLYAGAQTYTIAWENSGALGSDATVEHGKVEILPAQGITDMTQDHATGGHYAVDPGTMVTIKLIPDYGYQLKSTDLNGATVAAGSEVSTFTFEMPSTNLHLAALFEQAEDQMDCTASDVVSNVAIANGGNATSSGNLRMTVEDNSSYATDVSSAVTGSAVTTVASVDLTLDQIVSQGNNNYWTSNITEFTNPIRVGLQLDAAALASGETYSIVRDHNGVLTELDTRYNAATGTLSFDTNQFSTYTIVKKAASEQEVEGLENTTRPEENACNGILAESSAEIAHRVLTAEELERVANGETANIFLRITELSTSEVSDADKALIEAGKGTATLGMYLDLTLFKQIGTDSPSPVSNTNGTVTITLQVPENLVNGNSAVDRTYQIVRVHDGVFTVIDCQFDAVTGMLSFETDAFSTYALVYKDTPKNTGNQGSSSNSKAVTATADTDKKDSVPKTGDTDVVNLWFLLATLSGAGALYFAGRKEKYVD